VNENDARLNILLVENFAGQTRLVREALRRSNNDCKLHAIGAGQNTLSFLRREGPYAGVPRPDLVLFDLSCADKRRLKFLERVQEDTSSGDIPLVILTSPKSEQLVEEKYNNNSGCVMFSPIELDSFLHAMHSRKPDRFLNAVTLIQKLGFVLVRVPSEFTEMQHTGSAATSH